jgi:hypothetical protein
VPIDVRRFCSLRPFLFHLTAASNLPRIRARRELLPAESLLLSAGRQALLSVRRPDHIVISVGGAHVHLRDQRPLHPGSIAFEPGWDLSRFVLELNSYVFFWPGSAQGPISAGRRHFARYQSENPVLLRIPTRSLFFGSALAPHFAWVNSGAPRVSGGRHSPRGAATFSDAHSFTRTSRDVVEVVFRGIVAIPSEAEIASSPDGPYTSFS